MNHRTAVLAVSAAVAFTIAIEAAAQATPCASLASLELPDTTITAAEEVSGGPLPPYCRVAGVIRPTVQSEIGFETWMPLAGWNGRFNGVGNGGFAGIINIEALSRAVLRGYAAASTDTGHVGGGPLGPSLDATWAIGQTEKVIDFGPRSLHLTTQNAKAIVRAFYGRSAKYSYYTGCSTGGRQGLMQAQQFPEDYDGLVVGAPANYWTNLLAGAAWVHQARFLDPESWFSPALMPVLEAAVNAKCDLIDGIADGVLDDPRKCDFQPSSLLCQAGQDPATCFSAKQVAALEKIYAGPKNPSSGEQIFPGLTKGAESAGWPAWIAGVFGTPPGPLLGLADLFGMQYFKFMVFQDPAYNLLTFDFDADQAFNEASNGRFINAVDPDLRPLKHRGGKIIMYHGWNDAAISALNSIGYYESVASFRAGPRDTRSEALAQVRQFFRLFMVPGMEHCGAGPGPNAFGAPFALPAPRLDADHDVLSALERWVEGGQPPRSIIATKYANDNPAGPIVRQRPLCPYPQVAVHQGTGSTDEASSFNCRHPGGGGAVDDD